MTGEFVKKRQLKPKLEADDTLGANTEAVMREFRRNHGLVPDGIVTSKSRVLLDQA